MKGQYTRTPFCCGLMEIGAFGKDGWGGPVTKKKIQATKYAFIAVTRWSDVSQKTKFRAWGFKKVGRWKNPNTGRTLTLWAYFPKEEEKKKEKRS